MADATYYVDLNQVETGDGSQGTPFNATQMVSSITTLATTANTTYDYMLKGSADLGGASLYSDVQTSMANLKNWDLSTYGPWRLKNCTFQNICMENGIFYGDYTIHAVGTSVNYFTYITNMFMNMTTRWWTNDEHNNNGNFERPIIYQSTITGPQYFLGWWYPDIPGYTATGFHGHLSIQNSLYAFTSYIQNNYDPTLDRPITAPYTIPGVVGGFTDQVTNTAFTFGYIPFDRVTPALDKTGSVYNQTAAAAPAWGDSNLSHFDLLDGYGVGLSWAMPKNFSNFSSPPARNNSIITSTISTTPLIAKTGSDPYFDNATKLTRVDLFYQDPNTRETKVIMHEGTGGTLKGLTSWSPTASDGTWQLNRVRCMDTDGALIFLDRTQIGTDSDITLS